MIYNVAKNSKSLKVYRAKRVAKIHEMSRGKKEYSQLLFDMLEKEINAIDDIFEMTENVSTIDIEDVYLKRILFSAWAEENERKKFFRNI